MLQNKVFMQLKRPLFKCMKFKIYLRAYNGIRLSLDPYLEVKGISNIRKSDA